MLDWCIDDKIYKVRYDVYASSSSRESIASFSSAIKVSFNCRLLSRRHPPTSKSKQLTNPCFRNR
ncbi:hypothetical protein Plhal304r1_c042g0121771 [Plasmopara halstedii]